MMELNSNINSHRPLRTQKQYYTDNITKLKMMLNYIMKKNKDEINEKNTCKCGCVVLKRT
jgi:hypothetical protein